MSRPRKPKREKSDSRAIEGPPPDYSDPAARQSLKDTVKGILGIDVPDDDPCFDSSPEQDAAHAGFAAAARRYSADRLMVDPKGDEPLAGVLGRVILGHATPFCEETAAKLFLKAVKHPDPSVAARLFRSIMVMKENVAQPHRNAFAFLAYSRFIEETGREPSKPELRAYIEARRDQYKGAPGANDNKGWTRLWDESGLSDLEDR